MADVPSEAPEHCPGTQSESAGKASACAGCPNQSLCSSGAAKQPDPGIALVKERLSLVRNKLLVLSGKGGVGKSTVTSLLSRCIATNNPDKNVGVLDIDICGPSQPRVLGALGEQVHQSGSGWSPVVRKLIKIERCTNKRSLLLFTYDRAGMIRQFLSEVDWGSLDYLVLDTPPGTSDEHLSATSYLKDAGVTGAVIVTTPPQVALLDVRKEIDFCRKVNIPILGVIENMTMFVCPKCKNTAEIFPASTGGAQAMSKELNVEFLGSIPLDPLLARCCDEGKSFLTEMPDSPTVDFLNKICKRIVQKCEEEKENCPNNSIQNT
ncbi:hypothetical protein DMN91_012833 [Ooceraea biroi]|uniref:Cytosolic Fe-S cluster assembly factor NUBP1 homolog n=1 Tax=Ooceraea biroi TaxID=2015173 RepID=A0A3L8D3X8_OOCBI|nr:hypothetical protein DMN91_012833 [Ooceraea biroi]